MNSHALQLGGGLQFPVLAAMQHAGVEVFGSEVPSKEA
jgi:hypothetical protein